MHFMVSVDIGKYGLTEDEIRRLEPKLHLVEVLTHRAVDAMVKGTLKYATDNHTYADWLAYAQDDALDAAIYTLFLGDSRFHG